MNLARWLISAFHGIATGAERRSGTARTPYTGAELRAIRKRNGVGRPPAVRLAQEARIFHKWTMAAAARTFDMSLKAYRERDKALQDAVTTGTGVFRVGYDHDR